MTDNVFAFLAHEIRSKAAGVKNLLRNIEAGVPASDCDCPTLLTEYKNHANTTGTQIHTHFQQLYPLYNGSNTKHEG
jgi:hypothetical protein